MPKPRFLRFLCCIILAALAGCASVMADEDDDGVRMTKSGKLMRGDTYFTVRAVRVSDLAAQGSGLATIVPALAQVAAHGGNTLAFDLVGFNADGTALDPAAVEAARAIIDRAFGQRMTTMVRVLGDSTDPAFRRNAVKTAAATFASDKKAIYWIDGDDASALARSFGRGARELVVAAPAFGELTAIAPGEPLPAANGLLVFPEITPALQEDVHFVIDGGEENLAALDAALSNPVEHQDWTMDPALLSEQERAEGFVPLFNGKNLDGWWFYGDNNRGFIVNDEGAIEWRTMGGGALYSAKRYGDYVLRLEWMTHEGNNSGVYIRAPRTGRQSKIGMEIQVFGDHGLAPDANSSSAIYDVIAPTENATRPASEWNELEIRCEGPSVQVTMNGVLVQDVNLDEHEELKYRLRRGFIGLQDHSNWVAFRNIRIKPL